MDSTRTNNDGTARGASGRPVVVALDADDPETFPAGTQFRIASVAMALQGAAVLLNEICDGGDEACGVLGILDLAVAELTRINIELEASRGS